MLPAPSLAHHYLRPRPLHPESNPPPLGPFVRVLTAAGSRYDHDACFGGVTLYDAPGFSPRTDIPTASGVGAARITPSFCGARARDSGWSACTGARSTISRDSTRSRRNSPRSTSPARGARRRISDDCSVETRGATRGRETASRTFGSRSRAMKSNLAVASSADANHGSSPSPSPSPRGVRFVARLLAARWDELRCVECGESKGPTATPRRSIERRCSGRKRRATRRDKGTKETRRDVTGTNGGGDDRGGEGVGNRG